MDSPAFGQADLTNCERELIQLAGSVQPHGALLVLREPDLAVVQASANTQAVLGKPVEALLNGKLAALGGDLDARVREIARIADLGDPVQLQCRIGPASRPRRLEGSVHRHLGGGLVVELEAVDPPQADTPPAQDISNDKLIATLSAAVQRFSTAATIGTLADGVVQVFRELTGYDRVMVYKFDPDGHGKIIAEARDPRLESLLGHHYPATDIPQRARALYLRNRVRMLVDVNYTPQPLVPELLPLTGGPLDMSQCALRSMSPLHLQYLKNMGVTATLVASLVRDGQLWGLVAAHHYSPRHLRFALRAAADLLAEVASTRITAIENYAHAQVALMVRRLEQRLVEATSTEGDWRYALFRNPRTLLQPLDATGAVLFHDGEILTCGEAPSTPELQALLEWVEEQKADAPFACAAVGKAHPPLASLTPTASGVLAVKLSTTRPDYLMWFRKEQLQSVTWAGDPTKPMVADNPLELSPRRSFAAWSEIVRGTAVPWSSSEVAMARAIGVALVDIIVQVHAVRLLIAEHQLVQVRATVAASREPVVIAAADGSLLFANDAFCALSGHRSLAMPDRCGVPSLFSEPALVTRALEELRAGRRPGRREIELRRADGGALPVALRVEAVPGREGGVLGFILTLADLRELRRADAARQHLEAALRSAARGDAPNEREADEVISAILTNASLAAMDIADAQGGPPVAPLLEEVEASTRRATALYAQIRNFSG